MSGFLSFRQLNFLAIMVVLTAAGLISFQHIAFAIFSYIYVCLFLSKVAFPAKKTGKTGRLSKPGDKLFLSYFIATAIIGLLLPILYISEGIYHGDKDGVKAAAPHLFLLSAQAFMEPIGFSASLSWPIGVLVPIFYNARRIFALADWLRSEFAKVESDVPSMGRLYAGKVLAWVNMGLWCFNLFGLLLPVFLPKACKLYYSESKEI